MSIMYSGNTYIHHFTTLLMVSRRRYLEQSILSYKCSKKQIIIIKHMATQFILHGTSPYHTPIRVCGPIYCHRLFKSKVIILQVLKLTIFAVTEWSPAT